MSVEARFQCMKVEEFANSDPDRRYATILMMPVYNDGGKGNEQWSKYTPAGQLNMSITNPPAIEYFEQGAQYRLLIEKA